MIFSTKQLPELERIDTAAIPEGKHEIRLFAVVRNESLRLPFFLKHYAQIGVDRLFVIDNGSTDGTIELLCAQSNVHIFRTTASYGQATCGISWIQRLIDEYGLDRWCLCVDADEVLIHPGHGVVSLHRLCEYLDREDMSALYCMLVDMYSDKPIAEARYDPGANPLDICPFFEMETIQLLGRYSKDYGCAPMFSGGMRKRLFGLNVCLDKISLFKFHPPMRLNEGMHQLFHGRFSKLGGAVLHFKYLSDFVERIRTEASRGEHWSDASEYKRYSAVLRESPQLSPYCSYSKRYRKPEDLLNCAIMRSTSEFDAMLNAASGASSGTLARIAENAFA